MPKSPHQMAEESDYETFITNPLTQESFRKENFLGKGAFSRCYEYRKQVTEEVFAVKVVLNVNISKKRKIRKHIHIELEILRTLSHPSIVSLHSSFEQNENLYIVLELCPNRSLVEMLEKRKTLTVPEVRYFLRQIALAVKYLHGNYVIHRDLKLANIFLDKDMRIKIGDFNLAARAYLDEDWNSTKCGTTNFIAPEIINELKYSFGVDIWSIGCVVYYLLVGGPPFGHNLSLGTVYDKIRNCDYTCPIDMDADANSLISQLLQKDPENRLCASGILNHRFLMKTRTPPYLPTSCLTVRPSFTCRMTVRLRPVLTRTNSIKRKDIASITNQDVNNNPGIEEFYDLRSGLKRKYSPEAARKRRRTLCG